jgi:hypothetical protein
VSHSCHWCICHQNLEIVSDSWKSSGSVDTFDGENQKYYAKEVLGATEVILFDRKVVIFKFLSRHFAFSGVCRFIFTFFAIFHLCTDLIHGPKTG